MFRTGFRSDQLSAVRFGALGVAAVLVLGGCTGSGDDPGAEAAEGSNSAAPSVSASAEAGEGSGAASASATPTPTVAAYKPASAEGPAENVPLPVMPELAKQESKEGLREFARYWYAMLNYSFETGDVEHLKQISDAGCILCQRAYEMLDIGYEDQDWIVGGGFTVHGTQSNYVLTSKSQYQVLVHLEQDALEYRGPGAILYERDAGLDSNSVHMIEATYVNGQWHVHNAVIIK